MIHPVLRLAGLSSQKEDCEMLKLPQTDTYRAVLMDRRLSGCRIFTDAMRLVPILAPLARDCFLCCVRAELCEASIDYNIPPLQLLGCKCLVWILLPAQHTAVVFLIFNSTRVERAKLPFAEEKHEVVQSQQCPGPHLRSHV